jgi:flagellar protein FlaD
MLKKLTRKLKISKSDKALISKLDRIKESREANPRKTPLSDATYPLPDSFEEDEETFEETEALTLEEQLPRIEEKITNKVEALLKEKTKNLEEAINSIKELDNRITKMDVTVSSAKQTVDMFKDRLDKVDENMLELLSLYEVVSNTVNPFVGDSEGGASLERFEAIEKQISELTKNVNTLKNDVTNLQTLVETSQTALPEGFEDQINERFTTLESSIQAFQELIEMQNQNFPEPEQLIENITQQVTEKLSEQITTRIDEQITTKIEEQLKPLKESIKTESNNPEEETDNHSEEKQDREESTTKEKNKYRLSKLDNRPETSIILLNWIEFLMEKVGRNNLMDVLDYYVEIGWISEEVSTKMLTYADGIDYYVEKPTWKLLPEDHTKSLMFIEQLRGNKIDKSAFVRLEREIDRVKHSMETLYGV